jgi:hypothetical protein
LPAIYDVYGLGEPVLGEEVGRLAEVLGVVWEAHISDYRGSYFTATGQQFGDGNFVLQANDLRDSAGTYLQLKDFPESRFLLFVNDFDNADGIRARLTALPQWRFLRRRVLD